MQLVNGSAIALSSMLFVYGQRFQALKVMIFITVRCAVGNTGEIIAG
jgi:hypothetical protein